MALSSKEKKELARQRKENAKQAQKFHKEQEKRAKKSSSKSKKQKDEKPAKPSASKIEEAVNSGKTAKFQKISREEKFRRESEEKIRNLKPQDFEDGYYIDEYSEKTRSGYPQAGNRDYPPQQKADDQQADSYSPHSDNVGDIARGNRYRRDTQLHGTFQNREYHRRGLLILL